MASHRYAVVASTARMPTQAEQDRLSAAIASLVIQSGVGLQVNLEHGPPNSTDPLAYLLAAVAAAIALGAAGAATGLAAADGRADVATLAAIGAAPRVRRVLSLSQSGVIAGLGSLMGGAAGLGAAFAVLVALNHPWQDRWPAPSPLPLVVPWLNLGTALVAVPVLAMLSAGLLTRSRLPIERRRPT